MIVEPTVNELLKHAENRYALVIAASRRARDIAKGEEPLVTTDDKSPVTIAAEEIADEKVYIVDDEQK
ncbi:MAG: DNA-directed RNA polymerase subunit omega [Clostridia bacterium]|nr:DNA-directed RNA polymerase subunit omega [Clostridia bacterium]